MSVDIKDVLMNKDETIKCCSDYYWKILSAGLLLVKYPA